MQDEVSDIDGITDDDSDDLDDTTDDHSDYSDDLDGTMDNDLDDLEDDLQAIVQGVGYSLEGVQNPEDEMDVSKELQDPEDEMELPASQNAGDAPQGNARREQIERQTLVWGFLNDIATHTPATRFRSTFQALTKFWKSIPTDCVSEFTPATHSGTWPSFGSEEMDKE